MIGRCWESRLIQHSSVPSRWTVRRSALYTALLCAALGLLLPGWLVPVAAASPLVATTPVCVHSDGKALALDQRNHHLFVACDDTVLMLDSRSGALLRTVHTALSTSGSPDPPSIAVDAQTARVFVSTLGERAMLDADSGAIVRSIPLAYAYQIAVDERTNHAFFGVYDDRSAIVDARTGRIIGPLHITAGDLGMGMLVDAQSGRGFAAEPLGKADVFDTQSGALLRTVDVGDINAVDVAAGRVLADDGYGLALLDARSGRIVRAVATGRPAYRIAADTRTGLAFAANLDGTVSVVETRSGRLLRTVRVDTVADAAQGGLLLAVDEARGRVIVVSGSGLVILDAQSGRLLHRNPLRLGAQGVAVDEQAGRILALTTAGVSVLEESRL